MTNRQARWVNYFLWRRLNAKVGLCPERGTISHEIRERKSTVYMEVNEDFERIFNDARSLSDLGNRSEKVENRDHFPAQSFTIGEANRELFNENLRKIWADLPLSR